MICINCGTEVTSKFCPSCGQPSPPRKITLGHMYHDFQARIYGFDGMFPRTLRDLTIHPGMASRTFIQGNRVQYYGPVGYFFLMITVLLLLMSLLDVDIKEFLKASGKSTFVPLPKEESSQSKVTQMAFQFVSDNLKAISFVMIPLQAFCSKFLYFRKRDFNFLEQSVLPFYVQGHIYWISIVSVIYYKVSGQFLANWLTILLALAYFSYSYADFFDHQSKVKLFFKGLGVYITAQIFFVVVVTIVIVAILLLNPDLLEMVRPVNNR